MCTFVKSMAQDYQLVYNKTNSVYHPMGYPKYWLGWK